MYPTSAHRHRCGRYPASVLSGSIAALSIVGLVATIAGSLSMSAMGAEPMPGGWMLSNAWIRQYGRTPAAFALIFLGHWLAMTTAMMLPSFAPTLQRCHDMLTDTGVTRPGLPTLRIALGWFAAWMAAGMLVFGSGIVLTGTALRDPALARWFPFGVAAIVLAAGVLQSSAWKSRHLAGCRDASPRDRTLVAACPWRHGLHLGRHCVCACSGWMATLLVTDAMDLRAMALVAFAIAVERLAIEAKPVAEKTGAALVGVGFALFVEAVAAQ